MLEQEQHVASVQRALIQLVTGMFGQNETDRRSFAGRDSSNFVSGIGGRPWLRLGQTDLLGGLDLSS